MRVPLSIPSSVTNEEIAGCYSVGSSVLHDVISLLNFLSSVAEELKLGTVDIPMNYIVDGYGDLHHRFFRVWSGINTIHSWPSGCRRRCPLEDEYTKVIEHFMFGDL